MKKLTLTEDYREEFVNYLEHAEEMGKISMSSIPDGKLQEVITFLEAKGYICSISPNTDYLIIQEA